MARFRPFGRRQADPATPGPDPWLDDPVREPPAAPGVRRRGFDERGFDERGYGADGYGADEPHDVAVRRPDGRDDRYRERRGTAGRGFGDPDDLEPLATSLPATAAPATWAPRRSDQDPVPHDDAPVTDPFGFPPVPPVGGTVTPATGGDRPPAWAAWVPGRRSDGPAPAVPSVGSPRADEEADDVVDAGRADGAGPPEAGDRDRPGATAAPVADHSWTGTDATDVPDAEGPAVRVVEPAPVVAFPEPRREPVGPAVPVAVVAEVVAGPDPAEAAALAGAFAADYLSWDEDDPARRGRALSDHLPGSPAEHALLGWSGAGRQRAEIVLPGAVRPDGDERVLVDVRVRVTPYRRVSRSEATPEPDPQDTLGTPAAAPPVTARGWRGLAARWVRLGVTVVRDGDRLVVDAGEEAFDAPIRESPRPPSSRTDRTAEDPTLDGDDDTPPGGGR